MRDSAAYDQYATATDLYNNVPQYQERTNVAFFVDATTAAKSPILEIGCGTKHVLIPTTRAGLDIVNLDASPKMLAVYREQLQSESGQIQAKTQLVEADMRVFDLNQTFTLITVPFRPFQHLITIQDQCACLATIRKHLIDNGRLILNLFNPSLDALARFKEGKEFNDEPKFTVPDDQRVVRRHKIVRHDRFAQVNQIKLIYYMTHQDDRTKRLVHSFPIRYLFRFKVKHLLARYGFEIEHLYASYDKSVFRSTYPRELVFVTRKSTNE